MRLMFNWVLILKYLCNVIYLILLGDHESVICIRCIFMTNLLTIRFYLVRFIFLSRQLLAVTDEIHLFFKKIPYRAVRRNIYFANSL